MPIKDLHKSCFDEGTIAKLDIFESYLEAWLPVFIYHPHISKVNICDFFAGAGTDSVGNYGSPLLILKILEEYEDSIVKNKLKINIILNELDQKKFNNLKDEVEGNIKNNYGLKEHVKINYFQRDFKELFEKLSPSLKESANLIFLDQNGIKHVSDEVLLRLASFSKTDFMFFISSSYFNRFPFEDYFPGLQKSIDRRKPSQIHREILKHYKSILPPNNPTKLYPFSIKKKGRVYGLIFGSKHWRGVEKFLQIAWKKNKINGEANFDIDEEYKNKQLSLFEPPKISKLDKFNNDLREYILSKEEITNEEILAYTLENGFEPKQAAEILKNMRKEKLLRHFSYPRIGCKQVYTEKHIVTFRRSK